jgi:hypothetical protein
VASQQPARNPAIRPRPIVPMPEEQFEALRREYDEAFQAYLRAANQARTEDDWASVRSQRGANPARFAGGFLDLAEKFPGTPAAADALIWIVTHVVYGSLPERAKELIIRDHIRSEKLAPVFNDSQLYMTGSKATETMFRQALARNPDRTIQGLACYYLARFLDGQASAARVSKMIDPNRLQQETAGLIAAGWGQDYNDRLKAMDPQALEREAVSLYERVIKDFGSIKDENPIDRLLPQKPATQGEAARVYLDTLTRLAIGKPAPEITGEDLDGKPMKLSDERGKVVVLFFCGLRQMTSPDVPTPPAVRAVERRLEGKPFVVRGVTVRGPVIGNPDRAAYQAALKSRGIRGRFWFDQGKNGGAGPIQTAWNLAAPMDVYVLDPKSVIRFKHMGRGDVLERAVDTLMKEMEAAKR